MLPVHTPPCPPVCVCCAFCGGGVAALGTFEYSLGSGVGLCVAAWMINLMGLLCFTMGLCCMDTGRPLVDGEAASA